MIRREAEAKQRAEEEKALELPNFKAVAAFEHQQDSKRI